MSKIIAIESSCDETAAAVVKLTKKDVAPLSSTVASQIKIHTKTHGVVPEVAARAHLRNISAVVSDALKKSDSHLNDIDYIAVTAGPGLITSLMVGLEFAKSLALATGKMLIPVNHMAGHMYSPFLNQKKIKFPNINLIVSGGHTYLVLLQSKKNYKVIGQTLDDAAGEAFDKTAKMLGLPYPGGPQISRIAQGAEFDYGFPRPMINSKNFNFSFAGLKTAVLYKIKDEKLDIQNQKIKTNLAASFQNAVTDTLSSKTLRGAKLFKAKSIALSGGVAANKSLREKLESGARQLGVDFYVPDFHLCTDNALMIANAAAIMLKNGFKPVNPVKVKADPNIQL